ncbi:hypothetical protein DAI22_03g307500 [Oryza sativa Japonica Group]|nr:hypothetical protein DAI22_03g307500 [Oryza sativa Japonica Group]
MLRLLNSAAARPRASRQSARRRTTAPLSLPSALSNSGSSASPSASTLVASHHQNRLPATSRSRATSTLASSAARLNASGSQSWTSGTGA